MPPSLADRLNDMLMAIEESEALLTGVSKEELAKDRVRRLAFERLLEILSEASRHIPEDLRTTVDVPWRDIADIGSLLRHAYHRVDPDTLWYIAKNDLPFLKAAIQELIARSGNE